MEFIKITEQESNHKDLEKKSVVDLVNAMHEEDNNALKAVHKVLPKITELINEIKPKIKNGGRLFYIGAGTSGRLGVLDASECPPTFGTPPEKIVGLVAGGIPALYSSIEVAEDDLTQAWKDLSEYNISSNDFVIGIAASGTTPYVIGGLKECQKNNIKPIIGLELIKNKQSFLIYAQNHNGLSRLNELNTEYLNTGTFNFKDVEENLNLVIGKGIIIKEIINTIKTVKLKVGIFFK